MQKRYTNYNIHGKGVPELFHVEKLENALKEFSTEAVYNTLEKINRVGTPNSSSNHAINASLRRLDNDTLIKLLPVLKECFPNLLFRVSGKFVYGPGDAIDEHTNFLDPSNTLYITYATGKSSFSYRYSLDDEFITTYDDVDGITLRAFELTGKAPYTFHKVVCESGYRVSIGLRYVINA
jgi:hypothetical protein